MRRKFFEWLLYSINMNRFADRAVQEMIHTITAQIGIDQIKSMISESENSGDKYTSLSNLWFEHMKSNYPDWRNK